MIKKFLIGALSISLIASTLTIININQATPAKAAGTPTFSAGAFAPINVGGGGTSTGGNLGGGSGGPSSGGGYSIPAGQFNTTLTCDIARQVYRDGVSCTERAPFYASDNLNSGGMNITCAPRNGASAYAIVVRYQTWRNDGNVTGNGVATKSWPIGYTCQYPSVASRAPIVISKSRCFYDFAGQYFYSASKSAVQSGGTKLGNRNPNHEGGDPAGGANCNTSSNSINYNASAGDYGYYRIEASLKYRDKTVWGYQSWTNDPKTWVTWSGVGSANDRKYYAYSCSVGTSNSFAGPAGSAGALPTVELDVSKCSQSQWQCTPQGQLNINNTHNPVQLMRDGNSVPFTAPNMLIHGNGVRGYSGQSSVADSDTQYKITIPTSGVSPTNTGDPNSARQYYKLFKANGTTAETFGTWRTGANSNRDKVLNFYWSSNNGESWSAIRSTKFNAQFLIPRAGTVGGGSTMVWVRGTGNCVDLTSNKATIVRSANS